MVGGMDWGIQLVPPLMVAINAAPLGAPPLPTVEPTAQHLVALTQVTATTELTGLGGTTGANEPLQGDPALNGMVAKVTDVLPGESVAGPDVHPARTVPIRRLAMAVRFRKRDVPLMVRAG